jgi:hypothetical protein
MRPRPDLDALIREARAAFEALSPEDQAAHRQAQAESWVRGNLGIDRGPDAQRTVSAAAPSCDCPAERYRHALAQIGRYSPCSIAQGYVDEALFAGARAKGDVS